MTNEYKSEKNEEKWFKSQPEKSPTLDPALRSREHVREVPEQKPKVTERREE